jgi:hypothetical protein
LKTYPILIFLCLLLFSHPSTAAESNQTGAKPAEKGLIDESSVITGFGTGNIAEGHYTPILFIWHVGMDTEKLFPKLKCRGRLSLFLEPQFNFVTGPDTDFEVGMGIGIQYLYPFSERISAYILASTGPHYISVVTEDQANRFNFADLVGCGLYYFFSPHSAINVGYRFRHISNAGLAMPNDGIDTQFMTVGYSVFF